MHGPAGRRRAGVTGRALVIRALRRALRRGAEWALYQAKAAELRCVDFGGERLVAILRYHSVSTTSSGSYFYVNPRISIPPDAFDAQMAFLAGRYRCLRLDEVVEALRGGRELPRNAVVVTFDDGYRDNYEYAYPILRRHGIPATFYVVTGCLDGGEPLWTAEIRRLVHDARRPRMTDPITHAQYELATPAGREAAISAIKRYLVRQPRAERNATLAELRARADATARPERRTMMTWAEVREMAQNGMDVGAHTVSHPRLPAMPLDEAEREIRDSRAELTSRLGRPVAHFSYPNPSDGEHVNRAVQQLVARAGYATATTSHQGYVHADANALALQRLMTRAGRWDITWDLERPALGRALTDAVSPRPEPPTPPVAEEQVRPTVRATLQRARIAAVRAGGSVEPTPAAPVCQGGEQ
jgi:peptidoglycan/xylan/chitin deacetylase (PgdA/CDA1 family)